MEINFCGLVFNDVLFSCEMWNDEYIYVLFDFCFLWINNKSWIVFLNLKNYFLIK